MDQSNFTMVSPKYVENLSMFYCQVTSHVITEDGKLLLATIKAGHLAVFPVRNYLKEIYLSTSDLTAGEPVITGRGKRFKPLSLLSLDNSLSLQLDNQQTSSQYKLVAGGHGKDFIYYS